MNTIFLELDKAYYQLLLFIIKELCYSISVEIRVLIYFRIKASNLSVLEESSTEENI